MDPPSAVHPEQSDRQGRSAGKPLGLLQFRLLAGLAMAQEHDDPDRRSAPGLWAEQRRLGDDWTLLRSVQNALHDFVYEYEWATLENADARPHAYRLTEAGERMFVVWRARMVREARLVIATSEVWRGTQDPGTLSEVKVQNDAGSGSSPPKRGEDG